MRSFSKKLAALALVLLPMLLVCAAVEWASAKYLVPISYADYLKYDMDQLEAAGEPVDLVFVGASRTMCTFDPAVFESTLGFDHVINAASSFQQVEGSYYQLKDLIERFHPRYAVVGLAWNGYETQPNLQGLLITRDRLTQPAVQLAYTLDCFSLTDMAYFLPSYRYRSNLSAEQIQTIARKWQRVIDSGYRDSPERGMHYTGNGYTYYSATSETGSFAVEQRNFSAEKILPERWAYENKMIELCKENGVELYFVSGMTTVAKMYSVAGYEEATEFFADFAAENGVPYCNLNYLKDRETFLPDTLMKDSNHVNGEGAILVSEKYAEILKAQMAGEDTADWFYPNFDAFAETVHRIVNVTVHCTIPAGATEADLQELLAAKTVPLTIVSLQNSDRQPEYQLLYSAAEGEPYQVLRDWSADAAPVIALPDGAEIGTIRVNARTVGSTAECEAYAEITVEALKERMTAQVLQAAAQGEELE